jgi:polar amino acid transport system substrate-binding protein
MLISGTKSRRVSALIVSAAAVLAACGGGGGGGAASSSGSSSIKAASKSAAIAAEVPSSLRSKGSLTIAADATYPPNEFFASDGTTIIGMDPDLAVALGQVMGLQVQVSNVTFDAILPGLSSAKYDLGMSSFTDTKEREKTYDFVTYFSVKTAFFIKANGPTINTLDDLCGHHVSVEKGTTQQDDSTAQDTKCKSAGKPGVDVLVFPDQNATNLALSSGRADVSMADAPVAVYVVQQSKGQFKLSGQQYGPFPYGIAVPKNNGMAKAVQDAVKELISDGIYTQILAKWGIQSGAITNPQINGATS